MLVEVVVGASVVVVVVDVVGPGGCVVTVVGTDGTTGSAPVEGAPRPAGAVNAFGDTGDCEVLVDETGAGAVPAGGSGPPVNGSRPAAVAGGPVVVEVSPGTRPAVTILGIAAPVASVLAAWGVRPVGRLRNSASAIASATPATITADVKGSSDARQR